MDLMRAAVGIHREVPRTRLVLFLCKGFLFRISGSSPNGTIRRSACSPVPNRTIKTVSPLWCETAGKLCDFKSYSGMAQYVHYRKPALPFVLPSPECRHLLQTGVLCVVLCSYALSIVNRHKVLWSTWWSLSKLLHLTVDTYCLVIWITPGASLTSPLTTSEHYVPI